MHCTPTLQTPSADLSLQTSIADPGCTHYLADLLCRLALPSDDPFSALAFWGGPGYVQSFPLPWPFGGFRATMLSSALAFWGGPGHNPFLCPGPFGGRGALYKRRLHLRTFSAQGDSSPSFRFCLCAPASRKGAFRDDSLLNQLIVYRIALWLLAFLWDAYGTPMGRLWDAYGTAYGTVKGILACDTNPTHHRHK